MKVLNVLLLVCLFTISTYGQEIPYNKDKKIEFKEIIDFDDELNKNQLLKRIENWAVSYWSEPNLLNKNDESISYKGSFVVSKNLVLTQDTYEIFYKLKIDIKEDKYRYILSDFEVVRLGLMKYPLEKKIKKKKIKKGVLTETQKLIESLKSAISSGNIKNEKDNW